LLTETPDPEETEVLVEIPDDPPVVVILVETPPTEADGLTETPVEIVTEKLAEEVAEHIRRTRVLVKSETTTEASPDGLWVEATISTSEGLTVFWLTAAEGHEKVAELGKKRPVAAAPVSVGAVK
jgi:hypothetical protein